MRVIEHHPVDSAIEPRTRALLMTVRRALLMICAAIEDYLGIETK